MRIKAVLLKNRISTVNSKERNLLPWNKCLLCLFWQWSCLVHCKGIRSDTEQLLMELWVYGFAKFGVNFNKRIKSAEAILDFIFYQIFSLSQLINSFSWLAYYINSDTFYSFAICIIVTCSICWFMYMYSSLTLANRLTV